MHFWAVEEGPESTQSRQSDAASRLVFVHLKKLPWAIARKPMAAPHWRAARETQDIACRYDCRGFRRSDPGPPRHRTEQRGTHIAFRSASEPHQPRSGLDDGERDSQPRLSGVGHTLRPGHGFAAAAANVRR